MHCKKCGAELLDWAKVCVICGTPTTNDSEHTDDLMSDNVEPVSQAPSLDSQGFTLMSDPDDTFVPSNKVFPDDFQDSEFVGDQNHVDYLDSTAVSHKVFPDDFRESTMEHERLDVEAATTRVNADLGGNLTPDMQGLISSQTTTSLDTFDASSFGAVYVDDTVPDPFEQQEQKAKKKSPVPAVVAVACAAAAIAACGFVFVPSISKAAKPNQSSEIVQKKTDSTSVVMQAGEKSNAMVATQKVQVALPVVAEGLNADGSRIPVHVTGTDANNAPVDLNAFVDMDGMGIELLAGNYEVRMIASPITEEGVMYKIPDGVLTVVVDANNKVTIDPEGVTLEFAILPATDVTDENIELARTWIAQDPQKAELADTLVERARTRRSDAIAAQQRQQNQSVEAQNDDSANKNENDQNANTNNNYNNYYDQTDDYSEPQNYTPPTNTNTNTNNNSSSSSSSEQVNPTPGGDIVNPGGSSSSEQVNPTPGGDSSSEQVNPTPGGDAGNQGSDSSSQQGSDSSSVSSDQSVTQG